MNRIAHSIFSIKQSHTNQQSGTLNCGEASAIECNNISLHVPRGISLCGKVKQQLIEERESCNTELTGNLQSPIFSTVVKSTGYWSAFTALYRKPTNHNSENGMSSSSTRKRSHGDGHEIDVGNKIVKQIRKEYVGRNLQKQMGNLF